MGEPEPSRALPPVSGAASRLASIDILRGLVMVLMVLDHARDYFAPFPHAPEDLSQASPALFLTRWVTHFCAPVFVFLAGTSIYLRQFGTGAEPARPGRPGMSRFLLLRGAWLIALEVTVVGASWGFLFVGIVTLQVIWALGVSMIVMAGLVRLPWRVSLAFGLLMVGLHNLLDPTTSAWVAERVPGLGPLWMVLHEQGYIFLDPSATRPFTPPGIFVVYPLIPWFGVMALGYAFGRVVTLPAARRAPVCAALGGSAILAFLVLRAAHLYGDPSGLTDNPPEHPILALLNTTKYPPSLHFLLMTLGPAVLAIPLLERLRGPLAAVLTTFGRVPLFFYITHIPLLHISSAVLWYALYGVVSGWQVGAGAWPEEYTPRLWVAYAAWGAALAVVWLPCRWFMRLRQRRRDWWLSYL